MDPAPKPPAAHAKEQKGILRKTADGFKSLADILGSIIRIGFNIVVVLFLITILVGMASGETNESTNLREPLYGTGPETIALVDLTGTMLDTAPAGPFDTLSETQTITPRRLLSIFEEIKKDTNVKAVVLRINSPGGTVTSAEEIYQMIKRFRTETGIPVIASQGEIAASGGYYISLAADSIMADTSTLTGSIGVIAQFLNFKELADTYGVKQLTITSGKNKSFLSPFSETDEVQIALLQQVVDDAYSQFLDRVKESREDKISAEALTELTDGRPLTGLQAKEAGFIDETGTFYDAIEYTRDLIKVPDAQVIEFGTGGLLENLLGIVGQSIRSLNPTASLPGISELSHTSGTPAYLYIK